MFGFTQLQFLEIFSRCITCIVLEYFPEPGIADIQFHSQLFRINILKDILIHYNLGLFNLLINIAHPDFREQLIADAEKMGLWRKSSKR